MERAERYQLTPNDPKSFSGLYSLEVLNAAGMNLTSYEVLRAARNPTGMLLTMVSHGYFTHGPDDAPEAAHVRYEVHMFDPQTGEMEMGRLFTAVKGDGC